MDKLNIELPKKIRSINELVTYQDVLNKINEIIDYLEKISLKVEE